MDNYSSAAGGSGSFIFSWQGPNGYFSSSCQPICLEHHTTIPILQGVVTDSVFIDQPSSLTSKIRCNYKSFFFIL